MVVKVGGTLKGALHVGRRAPQARGGWVSRGNEFGSGG